MHPFGGTPRCPKCSKAVYAAEQVLGPGRKLYHKPCLACMECNKRLDSYSLVEHDQEPYCKNCHTKLFGTRDLRQANLPHRDGGVSLSPTRTGSIPLPRAQSSPSLPPRTGTRSPPPLPARHNTGGAFSLKPTHSLSPTSPSFPSSVYKSPSPPGSGHFVPVVESDEHEEPTDDSIMTASPSDPDSNPSDGITHISTPLVATAGHTLGGTMSMSLNGSKPLGRSTMPLTTTPTGTRYGVGLTGELKSMQTGGRWGTETPKCPKCGKSVYFAEQIKAVGKTWHKGCLRCGECNSTLDSSRLTEKDGEPYCNRCYNKLHGPRGGGYALLGKAGG